MVSMRSEKPICAPPRSVQDGIYALRKAHMRSTPSLRRFPNFALETVPVFVWLTMALSRPFKGRSSSVSSFRASLLQAIDGVVSLAFCPQVVSQAPQHLRSSETQATCEGFSLPARVISLHSGVSRTVHTQEFSKVDVFLSLLLLSDIDPQDPNPAPTLFLIVR